MEGGNTKAFSIFLDFREFSHDLDFEWKLEFHPVGLFTVYNLAFSLAKVFHR